MRQCSVCNVSVDKSRWSGHVRSNAHKSKSTTLYCDDVEVINSSFKGRIVSYRINANNEQNNYLLEIFLNNIRQQVKNLIDWSLIKHSSLKINFEHFCYFLLYKNDQQELKSFATKNITIHFNYNFNSIFNSTLSLLLKKIEEFQERDSGWTFLCNSHLEININKYRSLSCSKYIALPQCIKSKKACLNIQNKDEYCFLWCVVAALYPTTQHPYRITAYPHFRDVLNIHGLSFPIKFSDIAVFEMNNPFVNIFLYGLKNNKTIIGPLYKSSNNKCKSVHLLLLENGTNSHYCLIKDLSRLVKNQITKHHSKLHLCETCLLFFSTRNQIETHLCGETATVLPEKGSIIKFNHFNRKQDIPFVIYADFETLLKPISGGEYDTVNTSYTQRHIPAAFGYNIVSSICNELTGYRSYRGIDCVSQFVNFLINDVKTIFKVLSKNEPMIFTSNDEIHFKQAIKCHICEHLLWNDKVRDHCHITGHYRGAAHRHCNLQYRIPTFIPIFFHNLSGYDCHLFIKELGEIPGQIKIIPKTKEKYMSFSKYLRVAENTFIQLRFLDSFNFLATSLDKLIKTMNVKDFVTLR